MWNLTNAFVSNGRPWMPAAKPVVESLEGRTLLSGSGFELPAAPAMAEAAILQRVAMPNVKGSYAGTIKPTGYPMSFSSTLVILTQSSTGALTGKITVAGVGVTNFAVTGKIDAKGNFTISWAKGTSTGSIKGKRAANGSLSGAFAGKMNALGALRTVAGTFTYTKK